MKDEDLVRILEDAGLSPYQARAYVALLDRGTTPATDVADAADVPDARIYDVLRDLESEGYVETYEQGRLTARPRDPEAVLADLEERSRRYSDAADEVEERWTEPDVTDSEVSIVNRFDTILDHARTCIENADNQIQLSVTPDQYEHLEDELERAHERGVLSKVTLCTDDDAAVERQNVRGVVTEVRHRTIPSSFLLLADRSRVCFSPTADSVNEYGVLVNDRTLAYVFHWFFVSCLWEAQRIVHTERTDDPPTEYVSLRQCVRDIEPSVRDGATVEVAVAGHTTESNASVQFEGTVTDVDYEGPNQQPLADDDPIALPWLAGKVNMTVDTGEEEYVVGGWGAFLEDVEATHLLVEEIRE